MIGNMKKYRILAVIVLYKRTAMESESYHSLLAAIKRSGMNLDITVLVYDNSETSTPPQVNQESVKLEYVHNKRNPGICQAYNYGLKLAKKKAASWLLLLDQDTVVCEDYVREIGHSIGVDKDCTEVVSIVPHIMSHGKYISPVKIISGIANGRYPLGEGTCGIAPYPIMAINSGSLWRVSYLEDIGGFLDEFPLDYLDHWAFAKLNRMRKEVFVMDVTIEHNLSISDFENPVSISRYQSIISSELRFITNFTPKYVRSIFLLKLLFRFVRFLFKFRNKQFSWMTWRAIFSLLASFPHKDRL